MIHIDRVNANVEVLRSPSPAGGDTTSTPAATLETGSSERIRAIVLEVLRDHLRELERRGLL